MGVNQNDYSLEYLLTSSRQLVQVYAELGSGKGVRHAGSVNFSVTDSSTTAFRIQLGATQGSAASSVYFESIDTLASKVSNSQRR